VSIGPLEPGAVHIWTAVVDTRPAVLATLAQTLNASENARTEAFRFERHRVRCVFRRGMLRTLLGRYVDADPARLVFDANAFGKPSLPDTASSRRPTFSVSHSGEMVVIAITSGREVGVDVEAIRPISDIEAIARHHFASAERARIAGASAGDRNLLFLRLWTRKEGCVKAARLRGGPCGPGRGGGDRMQGVETVCVRC